MKKYRVEFGFGENFSSVAEYQTIDGLEAVEASSAKEAALNASYTDGLENALFAVYELETDEWGNLVPVSLEPQYFAF